MKTLQEQIEYVELSDNINTICQFNYNDLNNITFRATPLTAKDVKEIGFERALVALFTIKRKSI